MSTHRRGTSAFFLGLCALILTAAQAFAAEETVKLADLIREALKNNPEIHVAEARTDVSQHKIPQATSLADPMFMLGYENEGTDSLYTFNKDTKGMPADSRWMFSLSQMFPYPGKRALKGEMATRDAEGMKAMADSMRLNTVVRVRELYYDLFLAYTNIDLLTDLATLFSRVEDAAARALRHRHGAAAGSIDGADGEIHASREGRDGDGRRSVPSRRCSMPPSAGTRTLLSADRKSHRTPPTGTGSMN